MASRQFRLQWLPRNQLVDLASRITHAISCLQHAFSSLPKAVRYAASMRRAHMARSFAENLFKCL
ncbi:hypothetical protein KCP71_01995 [Salmonella enterica subsp. enterica]|nr:hypothetical protein KCP71_01995 [Salmonella enterica subsp. enterica]